MATTWDEWDKGFRSRLETGWEYQDFIAKQIYGDGIVVCSFQSRKFQCTYGENALGLEIKYDSLVASTSNLWIEVSEKRRAEDLEWIPCGIYAGGNTWLFGIGNYEEFWIFSIRTLRKWLEQRTPEIRENGPRTSKGFLLPRSVADRLAERKFVFSQPAAVNGASTNGTKPPTNGDWHGDAEALLRARQLPLITPREPA